MKDITSGSDNVLDDLGIEGAKDISTKVQLAVSINSIIKRRRLRQADVSDLLDIPQPKVSALANFKLDGLSVERLMNFLTALDRDVEIRIRKKPKSRERGRIRVAATG